MILRAPPEVLLRIHHSHSQKPEVGEGRGSHHHQHQQQQQHLHPHPHPHPHLHPYPHPHPHHHPHHNHHHHQQHHHHHHHHRPHHHHHHHHQQQQQQQQEEEEALEEEEFEELRRRDVVSWTAMVWRYVRRGEHEAALGSFWGMVHEGIEPNAVSLCAAAKACAGLGSIDAARSIHAAMLLRGLAPRSCLRLATSTAHMYAKCGSIAHAELALADLPARDAAAWNALIGGSDEARVVIDDRSRTPDGSNGTTRYARIGAADEAVECAERMKAEGVRPDAVTYGCLLQACASSGRLGAGEDLHAELDALGLFSASAEAEAEAEAGGGGGGGGGDSPAPVVLGTILVDMYAKCGALDKASRVFQRLRERDVVAWSALIGGYVEHGQCDAALEKFGDMRDEGVHANGVTYIHVLRACGSVGALGTGREIHAEICGGGGELTGARKKNPLLGTALVGMYARCGAVDEAAHALQSFCGFFPWGSAGIGAWNALLAAYAQAGELKQAIRLFEQMGRSAVADDDAVSLLLLLAACAHAGIVDAGHAVLGSVLEPSPEHLTCAADLFARAGRLDLALALLDSLPPPHRPPLLAALLGACRNLSNLPLASLAFEELVRAHPRSAFAYVCMRNIYCTA